MPAFRLRCYFHILFDRSAFHRLPLQALCALSTKTFLNGFRYFKSKLLKVDIFNLQDTLVALRYGRECEFK